MIKVLIVEDNETLAKEIIATLQSTQYATHWVNSATLALEKVKQSDFSIIIMDRMLPDGDGLDAVEGLRASGNEIPVIMLTALGNTENRVEGYRRGADDYLSKPFERIELLARVEALLRRSIRTLRADLKVFKDIELHIKGRTAHRAGIHLALSPKEFELLAFFVDHANSLVTRDMLLKHVWGISFDPGTNVVDVNVGRLRKKIEVPGTSSLLSTIRSLGYCLGELKEDS